MRHQYNANILDLRKEFEKVLDGDSFNDGVCTHLIFRQLDVRNPCVCHVREQGGSMDSDCVYCKGEGFQWKEYLVRGYLCSDAVAMRGSKDDVLGVLSKVFLAEKGDGFIYLKWDSNPPGTHDAFFKLRTNSDGSLYYFTDQWGRRRFYRMEKYLVKNVHRFTMEQEETKYYKLFVKKDTTVMDEFNRGVKY